MEKIQFDRNRIWDNCEEFYGFYNVTNGSVREMCKLKVIHTRAVAENCDRIALSMDMSKYDRDMAWIIGLLHDFARFGQAVVTGSLDDSERFNHARLGARLLFTHRLIDDIIPEYEKICDEDRLVMEKAVFHHSDFHLPDNLTDRELLFCKIIREADQLDIFRTIVESGWEINYGCSKEEVQRCEISQAIEDAFYRHTLADYSKRVTPADFHMAHIALCFGLETRSARRRAVDQGYIAQMMDIEFEDETVNSRYMGMKNQVEGFLFELG